MNTVSPSTTGVRMFIPRNEGMSRFHNSVPFSTSTPARAVRVCTTSCSPPASFVFTGLLNAPPIIPPVSFSARHCSLPDVLSSFTTPPSA